MSHKIQNPILFVVRTYDVFSELDSKVLLLLGRGGGELSREMEEDTEL